MPARAEKLLERARQNKAGWSPNDLSTLYLGFGFIIREGKGSHRLVSHQKYTHLRAVFPEHARELAKAYIVTAVKNIEAALELEKEADEHEWQRRDALAGSRTACSAELYASPVA